MKKRKNPLNRILNISLAIVATVFCLLVLFVVVGQALDLRDVWERYEALPEPVFIYEEPIPQAETIEQPPHVSAFDTEMRGKNPDYMCWLKIDGTEISYPVVRGEDNQKYLNLTFWGDDSKYGTLFMDYRSEGDYVPNIIIYGHNARGGKMFGSLRKFLDEDYTAERPIITLVENDRVVEYQIFSVRRTDITDPAYFLDFSERGAFETFLERNDAPADAVQILTLSTCTSGGGKDARLIIQAALLPK